MFNINSRTIFPIGLAYIVVTGLIITIYFINVQNALIEDELSEQLDLAFRNIESGAPMHNVLNNNAYHANYYLNRQFNALEVTSPGRYLKSWIIAETDGAPDKLGRYIDTYASWSSNQTMLPTACPKTYNRFFSSENESALYDFRLFITVDDCFPIELGSREMGYLIFGMIIMSIFLILPLQFLSHIFKSLRTIEDFIGNSDPKVADTIAKQIAVEEIRNLFLRASKMQGKSVFYYRLVMQDVKHNILRILLRLEDACLQLDTTIRDQRGISSDKQKNLTQISDSIKTGLSQLKSANSHLKTKHVHQPMGSIMSAQTFIRKVKDLINVDSCNCDFPPVNIHIDFSVIEPALLNLGTNTKSHGKNPQALVRLNQLEIPTIRITIKNEISFVAALFLYMAKFTQRIDVENKDKNVYQKILGRNGLGLNMIKKSALALDGEMVFNWSLRSIEIGIEFPVKISQQIVVTPRQPEKERRKKSPSDQKNRVAIWFQDPENQKEAENLGLKHLMIQNHTELNSSINELIVDHNEDVTQIHQFKIRRIRNSRLLKGLAVNLGSGQS